MVHLLKKDAKNARKDYNYSCIIGGPHTIVNDPVLCDYCDIPFCKTCFEDYEKLGKQCPNGECDSEELNKLDEGKAFKDITSELEKLFFEYEDQPNQKFKQIEAF